MFQRSAVFDSWHILFGRQKHGAWLNLKRLHDITVVIFVFLTHLRCTPSRRSEMYRVTCSRDGHTSVDIVCTRDAALSDYYHNHCGFTPAEHVLKWA